MSVFVIGKLYYVCGLKSLLCSCLFWNRLSDVYLPEGRSLLCNKNAWIEAITNILLNFRGSYRCHIISPAWWQEKEPGFLFPWIWRSQNCCSGQTQVNEWQSESLGKCCNSGMGWPYRRPRSWSHGKGNKAVREHNILEVPCSKISTWF